MSTKSNKSKSKLSTSSIPSSSSSSPSPSTPPSSSSTSSSSSSSSSAPSSGDSDEEEKIFARLSKKENETEGQNNYYHRKRERESEREEENDDHVASSSVLPLPIPLASSSSSSPSPYSYPHLPSPFLSLSLSLSSMFENIYSDPNNPNEVDEMAMAAAFYPSASSEALSLPTSSLLNSTAYEASSSSSSSSSPSSSPPPFGVFRMVVPSSSSVPSTSLSIVLEPIDPFNSIGIHNFNLCPNECPQDPYEFDHDEYFTFPNEDDNDDENENNEEEDGSGMVYLKFTQGGKRTKNPIRSPSHTLEARRASFSASPNSTDHHDRVVELYHNEQAMPLMASDSYENQPLEFPSSSSSTVIIEYSDGEEITKETQRESSSTFPLSSPTPTSISPSHSLSSLRDNFRKKQNILQKQFPEKMRKSHETSMASNTSDMTNEYPPSSRSTGHSSSSPSLHEKENHPNAKIRSREETISTEKEKSHSAEKRMKMTQNQHHSSSSSSGSNTRSSSDSPTHHTVEYHYPSQSNEDLDIHGDDDLDGEDDDGGLDLILDDEDDVNDEEDDDDEDEDEDDHDDDHSGDHSHVEGDVHGVNVTHLQHDLDHQGENENEDDVVEEMRMTVEAT